MTTEHKLAEALRPCPFCGAKPHQGPTEKQWGQDGEPFQNYRIWCPKRHALVLETNQAQASAVWNTRAFDSGQKQGGDEPDAWAYELATTVICHDESGKEYGGWQPVVAYHKPKVPHGSIRNLRPLYASPFPDAQGSDLVERLRYVANKRGLPHSELLNAAADALEGKLK